MQGTVPHGLKAVERPEQAEIEHFRNYLNNRMISQKSAGAEVIVHYCLSENVINRQHEIIFASPFISEN